MINIEIYIFALFLLIFLGIIFWIVSLIINDVSIVDSLWSLMFIFCSVISLLFIDTLQIKQLLVFIMVLLWGLRLSAYVTIRNWGKEEDQRYQDIRSNNQPFFGLKSLYIVFGLQAFLAWVISMPLFIIMSNTDPINYIGVLGILLWVVGFFFESIGDYQLYLFKSNPINKGKLLKYGLWKYTRHPNYFGDACIWWGFYIIALSNGGWWSIYSPILMNFLLLKFSGAALLEKHMNKKHLGYDSYIASTNVFFPNLRMIIKDIKNNKK